MDQRRNQEAVNRHRSTEHGRLPFQVLMRTRRASRRDGDEAFGELKRIAQAGIAIWFYPDATPFVRHVRRQRRRVCARGDERRVWRQIAKWTHEAMVRKAKAGHVAGGSVFGYDNVRVEGHVERRINEAEAIVIRQMFARCAEGTGYTRLAKQLNEEHALTPRPRKGRPAGWCPSSVREVLHRPLYRGEVVYNRTRRRDADGTPRLRRAESDWIRCRGPELRIVPADAWDAPMRDSAASGRTSNRLASRGGAISSRISSQGSRGVPSAGPAWRRSIGSTVARRTTSAARRSAATRSNSRWPRGRGRARQAARRRVAAQGVPAVIDGVLRQFAPVDPGPRLHERRRELDTLDRELANLATAIAAGGLLPPLLAEPDAASAPDHLAAAIASRRRGRTDPFDRRTMERTVRACLDEWRARLTGGAVDRRAKPCGNPRGPLTLTPEGDRIGLGDSSRSASPAVPA